MGKVQGSSCHGREERSQGEQGLAQPGGQYLWVKESGCSVLPAETPPGNPIPWSVLSCATQLGVGWHQGCLWQDLGRIPAAAPGHVSAGQKNGSPGALVSWAPGLPRGRYREKPPAPPGSAPAARWNTTARFVLSRGTKRTGEIPNFSSGASVPVTPFWGWPAQAPRAPEVCSPWADSCPSDPPPAQANPKTFPWGSARLQRGEEGARSYKSHSPGTTPHPTAEVRGAEVR